MDVIQREWNAYQKHACAFQFSGTVAGYDCLSPRKRGHVCYAWSRGAGESCQTCGRPKLLPQLFRSLWSVHLPPFGLRVPWVQWDCLNSCKCGWTDPLTEKPGGSGLPNCWRTPMLTSREPTWSFLGKIPLFLKEGGLVGKDT